jgi:hypothetical protein
MANVKTFNLVIWADKASEAHTIRFFGISRSAVDRYIDYYIKNPDYVAWSTVEAR